MGFPSRLGQWATFAYASSRIIHHAPHSKGGQLGGKLKSQKDGASSLLSLFHALLLHPLHGTTRKAVCHQATAKSGIYSTQIHLARCSWAEGVFVWLSQSVYSGYLSIPYSHLSNILCYYSGSQLTRNGFHTLPNYITKSRANRNTGIFGTACLRPSSGNNPTHSCKCHFEQKALWHTARKGSTILG